MNLIVSVLKKNRYVLFLTALIIILVFMGRLSGLGFALSEYLAGQPKLNYIFANLFALLAFFNCYRCISKNEKLGVGLAIRLYVMFGIGMSGVYYLVYISHVGCFSLPADIDGTASILDFIYFSFITVTAVGYGDIVPRHTFVRVLVLLQVLFAVFLLFRVSQKSGES